MHPTSAFVPQLPLRATAFRSMATTPQTMAPHRSGPPRNQRFKAALDGMSDFDKIAQQLSAELQKRRVAEGGAPSMPPIDAPAGDQPIEITTGNNDMPMVILRHSPSMQQAEIYLYGAAVTKWSTRGENHFWVSDTNKWQPGGKAIRGGIPICFPQFGPYGDLVQHGFARVSDWDIRETFVADDSSVTAVFGLSSESDSEAISLWPHKFDAEYTVTLSAVGLETKLAVKNVDEKPFEFTCAFHNYFRTSTIENVRVFGFEKISYRNRLDGDKEMPGTEDNGAGILITEEMDRIYPDTPEELATFDFGTMKVLKIKKTATLSDTTLWNPYGAEGADPGWDNFLCIEPARITNPATVQPGETWVGAQLLGVE